MHATSKVCEDQYDQANHGDFFLVNLFLGPKQVTIFMCLGVQNILTLHLAIVSAESLLNNEK